jgi:hypothetical protein
MVRVPADIHIEVFPKQTKVPHDGLGNLVKIPLGIHRVTGRCCHLLRTQGQPYEEPMQVLRHVEKIQRAELLQVVERATKRLLNAPPGPRSALSGRQARVPVEPTEHDTTNGLSALPDDPPYSLEQDQEVQWLRQRCAVVNELIHRCEATRLISNDERMVLTYTMGHLQQGAQAVNAVLKLAMNVDAGMFLKSPLRSHPTSCPKIRVKLPMICSQVGCDCQFERLASYPHPLVHLEGFRSQQRLRQRGDELPPGEMDRLFLDWHKATNDLQRISNIHRQLESRIKEVLAKVETWKTPFGEFRMRNGQVSLQASSGLTIPGKKQGKPDNERGLHRGTRRSSTLAIRKIVGAQRGYQTT